MENNLSSAQLEMTQEEEAIYDEIKPILSSGIESDINQLIELLSRFDEKALFVIAKKDKSIRDFFETNELFNKKLAENKRFPDYLPKMIFKSIDGKFYSPFQILMGTFLLEKYEQNEHDPKAIELLNQACSEGSFHALQTRLRLNLQNLGEVTKEVQIDPAKLDNVINKISEDALLISNIYYSLGLIHGATALLDIAFYYLEIKAVKEELQCYNYEVTHYSRASNKPLPKKPNVVVNLENLLSKSLKYYYLSQSVSELEISKLLVNCLTKDEGIFTGFQEYFNDWDSCFNYLSTTLRDLFDLRSPQMMEEAKKKAQEEFNRFKASQ